MADTTTTEKKPTVQDQFKAREAESQANINKTYDTSLGNVNKSLQDAFTQNQQTQAQQRESVTQSFNTLNDDLKIQNDRNDTNLTQFANVRDANTGLGSQHRLNLNNARNAANAKLAYAQQMALQESDRQAALVETNYKNQVAAALADNDYKRAAALMDDYNNQDKWRQQQAQMLASYGNFDPYRDIYGDATANTMSTMWNMQNPDTAYQMGRISAEKYKEIRGHYPWEGGRSYSGGWGGGWGGSTPTKADDNNGSKADTSNWTFYNNGRTMTRVDKGQYTTVTVPSKQSNGRSTTTKVMVASGSSGKTK